MLRYTIWTSLIYPGLFSYIYTKVFMYLIYVPKRSDSFTNLRHKCTEFICSVSIFGMN